jgi:hypothetical protein
VQQNLKITSQTISKPGEDYPREQSQVFNVMINDLPAWLGKIKNIKSALFANDLLIWTSVPKRQEY